MPSLLLTIIRFLGLTSKIRVHGKENLNANPSVYVLWHGEAVMMPWIYFNEFALNTKYASIVSEHGDGEVASATLERMGIVTLRGSTSKGGAKALKKAISFIKKGGSIIITPDGPRGPRHSVADGAVAIAQIAKMPIIAVSCRASLAWNLKSWDKMFIPKPFSKIEFYVGEPFYVSGLSKEEAKNKIKTRMLNNAS